MTYRFRVSSVAFAQQKQLQVPMALIEYLAQPAFRGAAPMLSTPMMMRMPPALRAIAQRFIGLYVTANGQGEVTQIGRVTHRLPVSAQADHYGLQLTVDRSALSHECHWQTPIGA